MTYCANNLGKSDGATLRIGGLQLPGRAFLAPMAGVTNVGMRRLAERFGASLTVAEMVAADHYSRGDAANRMKAARMPAAPMLSRSPAAIFMSWPKRRGSRRTPAPR